jgi:hypothetical protein
LSRIAIFTLCLALSGCSSYKAINGYPENGASGYSEQSLDDGSFLLRVDGRDNESYAELRLKLLRRAAEICPGSLELSNYTMKQGFVIHAKRVYWPYVTAILNCTELPIDKSVMFESDV